MQSHHVLAPISLGELIDKITILQIKRRYCQGNSLNHVQAELNALEETLERLHLNVDNRLIKELKKVNQELWKIEDEIREQEHQKNFGENFIRLARAVYQKNDQRSIVKQTINTNYGSTIMEVKTYRRYN